MAVLVIGGGSAGSRHCRLAADLGLGPVTLVSKSGSADCAEIVVTDLKEVDLSESFELAIIASPATWHANHLETLACLACPILVEKPLAEDAATARRLLENADLSGKTRVGYNLRFDPGFDVFRGILEAGKLGQLLRVNAYVGQDLRHWRANRDYRQTVSAREELGGGVMRELSHEIDYLIQLMGRPLTVSGRVERIGDLEIDVEDCADMEITFESGIRASLHLNMLQFPFRRYCEAVFSSGTAVWDLSQREVRYRGVDDADWILAWESGGQSFDAVNSAQLEALVQFDPAAGKEAQADSGRDKLATMTEALTVLQVIEACHRSSAENRREVSVPVPSTDPA